MSERDLRLLLEDIREARQNIIRNFTIMKLRNGHTASKVSRHSLHKSRILTKKFPETVIVGLARKGKLAAAGQKAMQASLQKGLPVTILEHDKIYRVYPNGTKKLIKSISLPKHKYLTGKVRIA